VRSYLYVEDVADAYITVLLKGTVRWGCGREGGGRMFWRCVKNSKCVLHAAMNLLAAESMQPKHGSQRWQRLPPVQVGETYNIGTQKERSVVDVARDICKLFNRDPDSTVKHVRDRAFNDRRYFMWVTQGGAGDSWARMNCAGGGLRRFRTALHAAEIILSRPCSPRSCDKKLLKLGWQEKTSWEEGLRKTVDWYLQHAKREYWCASAVGGCRDAGAQDGTGSGRGRSRLRCR